ncbi:MAG: hypothetical protein QCH99_10985 [Candidatus Bathyarchaeota archaeon]|nr:hypothetical protein [Candidatus Bathyarchaeum tardum]WGM89001.1 MAG: hypothetical protein NUK63_08795 [Candidatus Bathyarchaeum tardum]
MNDASEEFRTKFPKLCATIAIALIFTGISQIAGWTLKGLSYEIVFLLQTGLLLAAGIFLVRTLFNTLTICRTTEKKTNGFANRISSSNKGDEKNSK